MLSTIFLIETLKWEDTYKVMIFHRTEECNTANNILAAEFSDYLWVYEVRPTNPLLLLKILSSETFRGMYEELKSLTSTFAVL
jgi:hypothetical protein